MAPVALLHFAKIGAQREVVVEALGQGSCSSCTYEREAWFFLRNATDIHVRSLGGRGPYTSTPVDISLIACICFWKHKLHNLMQSGRTKLAIP